MGYEASPQDALSISATAAGDPQLPPRQDSRGTLEVSTDGGSRGGGGAVTKDLRGGAVALAVMALLACNSTGSAPPAPSGSAPSAPAAPTGGAASAPTAPA